MFPVILALGLVSGLVGFAIRETVNPSRKRDSEEGKLEKLKSKFPMVTLDEAEDGAVLARRYGDKKSEADFSKAVSALRKKRVPI